MLVDQEGPPCAAGFKWEPGDCSSRTRSVRRLDQLVSLILGAEATTPVPKGLMLYVARKSGRGKVGFPWTPLPGGSRASVGKLRSEWSQLGHKVQPSQSQACA